MAVLAGQLREQAESCRVMGSVLYPHLLDRCAEDVEAGGPVRDVLAPHASPGRGGALALRFMAAVHRLVLLGEAPALAAHYASVGGTQPPEDAWAAFRAAVAARADDLGLLIRLPCQTNEVGRCAPLMVGFLRVAALTGLPLRVLEVGASAGLNLRFDRFRYSGGGAAWGDEASPVDLGGLWAEPPPDLDAALHVAERAGCDPNPLDPGRPEDRRRLMSSVWADQVERLRRLRGAFDIAARVPATVEAASLHDWLPSRLASARDGLATVVFHSVVEEYLPEGVRARFHQTLAAAGQRATATAPLAWLRLEPLTSARHHGVTLTFWPGGEERLLATSGAHGTDVRMEH